MRSLLLSALLVCAASVSADKKKGKPVEPIYALPEPDALPTAPLPDNRLPGAPELRTIIRHTVSKQQGIDVSHYQGNINWERVAREDNVHFVYIKATEGAGLVDDCYLRNLYGAKRVGLPVGSYHFFSPSTSYPSSMWRNAAREASPGSSEVCENSSSVWRRPTASSPSSTPA